MKPKKGSYFLYHSLHKYTVFLSSFFPPSSSFKRRRRLDEVKQRKLTELKEAGIPDKYCAEISRKITAPPTSFVK